MRISFVSEHLKFVFPKKLNFFKVKKTQRKFKIFFKKRTHFQLFYIN